MDRGKKATIEKNLSFVEEDKKLFVMDAERYILSSLYSYDIVYADPPFPMEGKINLLKNIATHHTVKEGGLFIIHYPVEEEKEWPEELDGFSLCDKRKYGRSMIRMYKAEEKC